MQTEDVGSFGMQAPIQNRKFIALIIGSCASPLASAVEKSAESAVNRGQRCRLDLLCTLPLNGAIIAVPSCNVVSPVIGNKAKS